MVKHNESITSSEVFYFNALALLQRKVRILSVSIFLLASYYLLSQVAIVAQSNTHDENRCERINQSKLSLSLSLIELPRKEVSKISGESAQAIFRLENNLTCPVFILVNSGRDEHEVVRSPQGGLMIKRTDILKPDSTISLVYLLDRNSSSRATRLISSDQIRERKLQGGKAVFFSVSLRELKEGFDLRIPFKFSWENNLDILSKETQHSVYFRANNFSKQVK